MTQADANRLSVQLWRQREILELLLFKCEEEQLLRSAGKTRWLPHAAREVERVVERLREAALSLAVTLAGVAEAWGLGPDARLEDLVTRAPTALWRELLGEHAAAITGLIREIRALRGTGLHQAEETLAAVDRDPRGGAAVYTSTGQIDYTAAVAQLIDASL